MEVWGISAIHLRKEAQTYSSTHIWSFLKDGYAMKLIETPNFLSWMRGIYGGSRQFL